MKDRIIICAQCERRFILSGLEQEKLVARGFAFPKRCPDCRKRKLRLDDSQCDWGAANKRKKRRERERWRAEDT